MLRDTTEFRERFNRWKNGEQVYDNGRPILPEYKGGKDQYDTFVEKLGPYLYNELRARGEKNIDRVYDYMMRQLALESTYGTSSVARNNHNYGGVGWNGKTYYTYKDDPSFVKDYVNLIYKRYGNALAQPTIYGYATELKKKGYFGGTAKQYGDQLAGMKTLSRRATAHRAANPKLYGETLPIERDAAAGNASIYTPTFTKPQLQMPQQLPYNEEPQIEVPYKAPDYNVPNIFDYAAPMLQDAFGENSNLIHMLR